MLVILNVPYRNTKQNRGGVGQKKCRYRDQDFLEHMFVATNHQYMMFFTQKGKCFWMRVYEIPEVDRQR
jgi:DNA gyrase subunit A